jgi:hypothetical protein
MRKILAGRRGQNTVEYLMMVSVVVGVVLVSGSLLKNYMPSIFGSVQQMITGAASDSSGDGSSGGGGGAFSGGSSTPSTSKSGATSGGLAGGVASNGNPYASASASNGADGATLASHDDGHPKAHGPPLHH